MESKANLANQPNPPYPTSGYPHPEGYQHPAPPPPYDANANIMNHQPPQFVQTVITSPQVGPDPASLVCPSCRKQIVTKLDYEVSTKTHIMAGLLCLFICWPCFWIPYVVDSCKNANHYCPNCSAFIGSYRT